MPSNVSRQVCFFVRSRTENGIEYLCGYVFATGLGADDMRKALDLVPADSQRIAVVLHVTSPEAMLGYAVRFEAFQDHVASLGWPVHDADYLKSRRIEFCGAGTG